MQVCMLKGMLLRDEGRSGRKRLLMETDGAGARNVAPDSGLAKIGIGADGKSGNRGRVDWANLAR